MRSRIEDRRSRIGRLLAVVAACSVLVPLAARAQTVTILHFNDVYEITPVEAGKAGGLARLARFRADLKAQHPDLITTLGGDYVSPSALGTARVNGERLAGQQMVAVLNILGLDWATFGNHEFDIPEDALRARLTESKFRMVSSNVTDGSGALFPNTVTSAVIPVQTSAGLVRVGLIGLTIDANKQAWVRYAPPVESARAAAAGLHGRCDVIVALTHLALAGDQQIAEQVPEIDLILGGHEHENWVIERGPHFTPIIKADANVGRGDRDRARLEGGRAPDRGGPPAAHRRSDEGRTAHGRGSAQVDGAGVRRVPPGGLRAGAGRHDH
ncbi:MAG TPA: metallophosphoesterase [Vicinamibacterales bacterium]